MVSETIAKESEFPNPNDSPSTLTFVPSRLATIARRKIEIKSVLIVIKFPKGRFIYSDYMLLLTYIYYKLEMRSYSVRAYIILGNNPDTEELVKHLRGRDNGTITIVDEEYEGILRREGDLTYVNRTYVDSVKDMNLPFVYYHYIQPAHRKDGRKWRQGGSSTR
ncbi:hypothetical protein [Sporosarcina sp. FSL K6-3457]|uniref:hypothetical protein n=1 Tax=Sporosarcina sp. FSL K6-3457 TaxID=2978204 RepID=UPI0030FA4E43